MLGMIRHIIKVITAARRRVMTSATVTMMLLMMLALFLIVLLMLLLLLLLRVMMVMMVVMMMVMIIQRGGGRRGWGQSRSTRTCRCTTGTSAHRRWRLHCLHFCLHQGSEDSLETRHFHATAAAIVRRHRLVGDVGSRRRHRHRHLFTCPRRRHITLIGGDRDDRRAAAIGCGAGTIGPLPERSQTLRALPFLRNDGPVVRWRQFLQEARQHQADRPTSPPYRRKRADSIRVLSPLRWTAPFINLPRDFRATTLTIFFPRNSNSYKPHKNWSPMFPANSSALAADASCIDDEETAFRCVLLRFKNDSAFSRAGKTIFLSLFLGKHSVVHFI